MDPHTQELHNKPSLLALDNALRKEDPQPPIANDNNSFQGQGNQMKPRKEQLNMQFTLILVQ